MQPQAAPKHGFRYALLITVSFTALSISEPSRAQTSTVIGWWVEGGAGYAWLGGTRYPLVNQTVNGGIFVRGSSLRPNSAYTWHGAFGIKTNGPWDMRFAYTGLRSRARKASQGFANASGVSAPWQSSPFTGTFSTAVDTANLSARTRSRYHIGDFDVGYNVGLGGASVRLFGGFRIASFNAKLTAQLAANSIGYGPNVTDEERRYNYIGAGPRVGFSADVPIAKLDEHGFRLVGGAAFAALFGTTRSATDTTLCTNFGGCASRSFSDSRSKTAYSVDGNLGLAIDFRILSYSSTLTAGYRVEYLSGVVSTLTGPNSLAAGAGSTNGNVISHGPFASLKLSF